MCAFVYVACDVWVHVCVCLCFVCVCMCVCVRMLFYGYSEII